MRPLSIALLAALAAPVFAAVNFDREVRPILSENCFACHGPDAKNRMAGLRFDTPDGGALGKGIIVPGNSAQSRILARVGAPAGSRMPPASTGKVLSARQIETLKQWIDEGAKWESHWSFTAPVRREPPAVAGSWAKNPVDNFILARLEKEGLKPSAETDRATLLRRVTYDLTGLPPTIAEIDSFLADKSPDAYEKRVDALLASPRFGERMAAQWLDLARYADTHGYHIDSHREAWHWRDWVIAAFNRNMPYDQFTIEQLAGDLIPNATTEQKLASGFNRNHMINFEGGAIPEEYQTEYVIDRLEATSMTWLGLSVGCARCHDHKYDPIPQRDFYRFFAFFNNVSEKGLDGRNGNAEPYLQLPDPGQKAKQDALKAAIAAHAKALPEEGVAAKQAQWEQAQVAAVTSVARDGLLAHYEFDGNLADSSGHYQYGRTVRGDLTYSNGAVDRGADFDGETHAVLGHVPVFERDKAFAVAFWLKVNSKLKLPVLTQGAGFEVWLDDFELANIQQRVPRLYLRFAGAELRTAARLPWPANMNHIAIEYDGSGKVGGIRILVNGAAVATETIRDAFSGVAADGPLELTTFKGKIDDLRVYSRQLAAPELAHLQANEPLRGILNIPVAKRSKEQKEWIRDYYLTNGAAEADRKAWAELKGLRDEEKVLTAAIPTTMVMSEITDKPRESFILARGDYRNQTEKVTAGTPTVLPPMSKDLPMNRLGLAKWLVDPNHPLTARVAVNRFWQNYFGTGIVKTAENFGSQGDTPVNQELLDWLATEFIRTGWDVKAMQRLIVTSAAYRQSSRVTPALLEKDPENRLIARGPRFRLPAEMVRDGELYLGGALKEQTGGAPVRPYQPKGLWEEIAFGDGFSAQTYVQGKGDDLHRRSLYTFWKRTSPPPEMLTFDAPDREKCAARRALTNTPLQALVLLNDTTYVEAARALATRMLLEGGKTPGTRLDFGFRLATARRASPREIGILRDALKAELLEYRQHEDRAEALLRNGELPVDPRVNKQELAAWTTVASMILNLDETITKE
ncbi:MAG TPA: DUF1553 domain-containing protein [Bryobacteraceae bacterium]|nr:DUF1553 domain-containing protein [Bryobacteraceae bacterium]